MPKLKTQRGAAKRFKKTGTGKIRRHRAFKTHIMNKMTPKRRRQLRRPTLVSSADLYRVKLMLPY
ncbi:MAG: 50S ribosomal protein L35 [candidate division Zixibacteria bacterium]|nr:50S ribosomal protein L35 [candidate division Zixibacteria bacterium]